MTPGETLRALIVVPLVILVAALVCDLVFGWFKR